MKVLVFSTLVVLISFSARAQNEDDALRYSYVFFGGSARNIATAGSFGAVGGDYSAVSSNPAGLARFKKHNFSMSTALEVPKVTADFYGSQTTESETYFKISNISYIKAYNLDPTTFNNWYGIQLGLGYNRIRSYNEVAHYTGTSDGSLLHSFINQANGTSPDNIYDAFPFDAGLAYDTYALDPGPNNTYVTDFTSGLATHDRTIRKKGGVGEYSFTLSGNYANKLFLGGALNINRIRYSDHMEHKEVYADQTLWIQDIRYLFDLDIVGWGIGARIGAIYLPVDWIRVGLSVQSPTRYNLSDTWSANMYTGTDDGLKYVSEENVPYGSYKYRLQTPMRGNLSVGFIYKKLGSLGVDVEYVDYAGANLSSKKYSEAPYLFTVENAQIENIYRAAINIKTGVEVRVNSQLYLRGGYANYQSPFKEGKGNALYATQFYTGGLGYNWGNFYLDAALSIRKNKADYYAYDPTLAGSNIGLRYSNLAFTITGGFRFE
jgi:long-subunit fatty acid transport protein